MLCVVPTLIASILETYCLFSSSILFMTECKLFCGTNAPGFLGYWKQPTKSDGIFGDAARITLTVLLQMAPTVLRQSVSMTSSWRIGRQVKLDEIKMEWKKNNVEWFIPPLRGEKMAINNANSLVFFKGVLENTCPLIDNEVTQFWRLRRTLTRAISCRKVKNGRSSPAVRLAAALW